MLGYLRTAIGAYHPIIGATERRIRDPLGRESMLPADAAYYREECVHAAVESKHARDYLPAVAGEALRQLDAYCDLHAIEESRPPLLVAGAAGAGKSALLAYWAQNRRRDPAARRLGEAVVCHFAGASWESVQVRGRAARIPPAPRACR